MHSHKVLFLDVDGVLNCAGTTETMSGDPTGVTGIDPQKAALFRKIITETGACFVVSSTWRMHPDCMSYFWATVGRDMKARWLGNTPRHREIDGRHSEIQAWLDMHRDVTRYVIVDDMPSMGHLAECFVQTHWHTGLTEEKAAEIIARLNAD